MIAIGRDHGGVELEDYLVGVLSAMGVAVRDCGTHGKASVDPSTRALALAGGSCSGLRPTGVLEGATGLPVGLHKISQVDRDLGTQINGQENK
jgi:ribose 5-phosphate isomerase RpiB